MEDCKKHHTLLLRDHRLLKDEYEKIQKTYSVMIYDLGKSIGAAEETVGCIELELEKEKKKEEEKASILRMKELEELEKDNLQAKIVEYYEQVLNKPPERELWDISEESEPETDLSDDIISISSISEDTDTE